MKYPIISFQIVQASFSWQPDVVAVCSDGSMWIQSLNTFYDEDEKADWKPLYKPSPELSFIASEE